MSRILIILFIVLLCGGCAMRPTELWIRPPQNTVPKCPERVESFDVWHQTGTWSNADTDDAFIFVVTLPDGGRCERDLSNIRGDERERGRIDEYHITIDRCVITLDQISLATLSLRTRGSNAWQPSAVQVTAVGENGEKKVVARDWPRELWFSSDPGDVSSPNIARPEWRLDAEP